jgi:glycosyltransferase involved in cell wall biosynthesis
MGCVVENFAAHVNADAEMAAHNFRDHERFAPPDLLIYQMSTGSPVAEHLLECDTKLVLNYHNITPSSSFEPWDPHVGAELDAARRQLSRLARHAHSAIADSHYNATELEALGMEQVTVVPVLWRPPRVRQALDPEVRQQRVLFVGRIAPNKRHEDLIAMMAILRDRRPDVVLDLVGGVSSERYATAVRELVERLGLTDAVRFHGSIDDAALDQLYAEAAVYVSASEHEGFCVPLIEAMATGLPVVARDAAAVPETLGDAGLLIDGPNPAALAFAVDRLLGDAPLRSSMAELGLVRAAEFHLPIAEAALAAAVRPLLETT